MLTSPASLGRSPKSTSPPERTRSPQSQLRHPHSTCSQRAAQPSSAAALGARAGAPRPLRRRRVSTARGRGVGRGRVWLGPLSKCVAGGGRAGGASKRDGSEAVGSGGGRGSWWSRVSPRWALTVRGGSRRVAVRTWGLSSREARNLFFFFLNMKSSGFLTLAVFRCSKARACTGTCLHLGRGPRGLWNRGRRGQGGGAPCPAAPSGAHPDLVPGRGHRVHWGAAG